MKKYTLELKWGFIFVGMQLLWMVMERVAGLHDTHIDKHAIVTNLVAIPAIAVYVLALLEKRNKELGGKITYMQGLTSGLLITLVVTILSPLTQYITSTFITPHYFTNAIAYTVSRGEMTQTDAENYFTLKNYIVQTLMFTPIMGLITTAIVALFVKKK